MDPDLVNYCFSDILEIEEDILDIKKQSIIDPLYSIDYLINEIKELERDKKIKDIIIKKLSNISK